MNTDDQIKRLLAKMHSMSGTSLANAVGVSRQAISKQLRKMVSDGTVVKHGTTKGATFQLAQSRTRTPRHNSQKRSFTLKGLQEDRVFSEFSEFLDLRKKVSGSTFEITNYAFTELLNNAIDHSKSPKCTVEFTLDDYSVSFTVADYGIGVFHSIQSKFKLEDENAAIAELLKGKTTTMSKGHSGEGIFFTSRLADEMRLRSHQASLVFGKAEEDSRIEACRFIKGTEVHFLLSRRSKKKLNDVFQEFGPANHDYNFVKTHILVTLQTTECVSRSSAKRMLARLDKFKEIVLDFKNVQTVGQGFADEVFRVFLERSPDVTIRIHNLKQAIQPIVKHVLNDNTSSRVFF